MNQRLAAAFRAVYCAIIVLVIPVVIGAKTYVVAHRGDSKAAPENTLASIRAARGVADFIEIDVCTTKDGELVVIHDDTVDRTTNGKGLVSSMTLAEVRTLDAGAKFSKAFEGERIPTIDEALRTIGSSAIPIIDQKTGTASQIVDAIRRNNLGEKCMVTSFDLAVAKEIKRQYPRAIVAINSATAPTDNQVSQYVLGGLDAMLVYKDAITSSLVSRAQSAGMAVFTWAADNASEVRALQLAGVSGIYADSPGLVRSQVTAAGEGFNAIPFSFDPTSVSAGGILALKVTSSNAIQDQFAWSVTGQSSAISSGSTAIWWPETPVPSEIAVAVRTAAGVSNISWHPRAIEGSSELINISARLAVGGSESAGILGFVIDGQSEVLLRAIGPTLASFGVTGVASRLGMSLQGSTPLDLLASNPTTTEVGRIYELTGQLGAFPLSGMDGDVSRVATVAGGAYTAIVQAPVGAQGVGLLECYRGSSGARGAGFRNLSTRGKIDGGTQLIAGFVVGGTAPGTYLIRAIGPTLLRFGVVDAALDPVLNLTKAEVGVVASNDDWVEDVAWLDLQRATTAVGGFPLGRWSRDSAIVMTLSPGAYSAVVSGRDNTGGAVLLEVYRLEP